MTWQAQRIDELKWAIYHIDGRLSRIVFGPAEKRFLLDERAQYAAELEGYGVPVSQRRDTSAETKGALIFLAVILAVAAVAALAVWIYGAVTGNTCDLFPSIQKCVELRDGY